MLYDFRRERKIRANKYDKWDEKKKRKEKKKKLLPLNLRLP